MAKKKSTQENSKLSGKTIKLSLFAPHPNNPRIIQDDQIEALKNDIQQLPEMLVERPMIADGDSEEPKYLLAGNQRWLGLSAMGMDEIPIEWISEVKEVDGWTEEKKEMLMIKDNISRGDWSYPKLSSPEWGIDKVEKMGLEMPSMKKKRTGEVVKWFPTATYPSNNIHDIPTLDPKFQGSLLINPVRPYGSVRRSSTGVGTYHFYVDDYRFTHVWDDPSKVISSGAKVVFEPNLSTSDTHPMTYGTYLIFKKRWFARYMQTFKINVVADLHVATKFYEVNLMGIPKGWNAFSTRGYSDEIEHLDIEYAQAQKISGKKQPFFIVVGGGQKAKNWTMAKNALFIAQHMKQRGLGNELK